MRPERERCAVLAASVVISVATVVLLLLALGWAVGGTDPCGGC